METAVHSGQANLLRLKNGVTVTMERLPFLHSASIGVWIRTGSANETPEQSGLAHFLEHLFFKGTHTRNVHQLMAAIESRGGQLNAFTSREYTCIYVKVLDQHVHTGIEILADILKNATFSDMEKERNVILEEIASIEDTPDDYVFDLVTQHHWPEHALGRPISGTEETVEKLSREDVTRFYEDWYVPQNVYVSIAGNFDEEAVLEQITQEFEAITPASAPEAPGAPEFSGGIRLMERDIGQAHLCLAFPGPRLGDPERYDCTLLSSVLGGGSTSRLFERIREDEGLAYAIFTFDSFHVHAGVLGVYAAIAPENFGRTLDITLEELRRLREEPLDEDELELNREQIKGGMLMAMENTFNRMGRMAKSAMFHDRIVPLEEVIEKIDAVDAGAVQAYAQQTFTRENTAITVLGPTGENTVIRVDL